MSSIVSTAMDVSRDTESRGIRESTRFGWPSSSLHSAPMDCSEDDHPSAFHTARSVVPPPFHQKVNDMRRSAFGEVYSYKQIRQIGKGGFGNCFLLERKTDGVQRVCKVQERRWSRSRGDYESTPFEMYYDYCEMGDLSHLIGRYYTNWLEIPETFMWHALLQLSEAVAFIHHGYDASTSTTPTDWLPIIHGDIKDQNIFLQPPNPNSPSPLARTYPSLVLGDFGLADIQPSNLWGTPRWQPPELPSSTCKADVWAVGAVMHALAHEGNPPITPLPSDMPNYREEFNRWCERPESRDPVPFYGGYSVEMHDCVFTTFAFDPEERIDALALYKMVESTWYVYMEPQIKEFEPLISADWVGKRFDENGVTLVGDADVDEEGDDEEQRRAASDAVEFRTSFPDVMVVDKTYHSARNAAKSVAMRPENSSSDNMVIDGILQQLNPTTAPAPPPIHPHTNLHLSPDSERNLLRLELDDIKARLAALEEKSSMVPPPPPTPTSPNHHYAPPPPSSVQVPISPPQQPQPPTPTPHTTLLPPLRPLSPLLPSDVLNYIDEMSDIKHIKHTYAPHFAHLEPRAQCGNGHREGRGSEYAGFGIDTTDWFVDMSWKVIVFGRGFVDVRGCH